LERLAYAAVFDGLTVPPPARRMTSEGIEGQVRNAPETASVQAVRNFFEGVFEGTIVADTSSRPYDCLHAAALELTRRFFQVSLTRMGISCRGVFDDLSD
jgi:hypothetical protein